MKVVEVQKKHQRIIHNSYVGRELSVLVEGLSSKSELDLRGHSTCNKVVNFPGDASLIGRVVSVRITEAKENSLYGRLAVGEFRD
jgi:tRNA-2-methylthio-N6-dimethylallyladenosine synthase